MFSRAHAKIHGLKNLGIIPEAPAKDLVQSISFSSKGRMNKVKKTRENGIGELNARLDYVVVEATSAQQVKNCQKIYL